MLPLSMTKKNSSQALAKHAQSATLPAVMPAEEQDDEDEKRDLPSDIRQQLLKNRVILLSGEIDKALSAQIVSQLLYLELEGDEGIKLFIDSPGGDVNAAFAIFDTIRFIKPPVHAIGMGLIASAGALVLLAARKERRVGFKNSHYMLHQPLSGMSGVASDIEIHAREVEKIRHQINEIIAKECKKTRAQVEKDTDRDFWLTADDAVKYGLIKSIIHSSTEL